VGPGARAAAGAADPPAPRPWYEEFAVNGFVSTSYSYNFNRPDSRLNGYRVFDFDDNSFKVDVAELVLQHAVAKPREAGFRVDLVAGGSIPRVSAAAGLFRDPATGVAEDFDLQQAYASYIAPLGTGLRLDAGKFITHHGAEVIEGYDGWNENATRSFLFGYAIPFTHTGLRAVYTFDPRVAATAMIVNGWDVAADNNRSKSFGAQLAFTPQPAVAWYISGMIGRERPDGDGGSRRLLDIVATLKPAAKLTMTANFDLGSESRDDWYGGALTARWQARERFALIARGEGFDDRAAVRTGTPQTLSEVTITPEIRVTPHLVVRADLRRDWSDRDAFVNRGRSVGQQTTVLLNVLGWF
jgi:putative OmpL-like beta-barrel porin-2